MSLLFCYFFPVSVFEFIYAQGPDNMKGLLIGIYYFLFGVCNLLTSGLVYYISTLQHYVDNCRSKNLRLDKNAVFWYYCGCSVVGVVGLGVYVITALWYKTRMRNNPVTDIMRINAYF